MRAVRGNDISMIFQEPMTSLNPVFTVGFQLEEVLRLHMGLSGRKARPTRSGDHLTMVSSELSLGGQKSFDTRSGG